MKIYTRKGDSGRTKLFGGVEVDKHDARVAAYGTLDELNASLGLVMALDPDRDPALAPLERVQEDLFVIGSRLAAARPERELERGTIPALEPDRIAALEEWIDRLDEELPALTAFVLPGGSSAGAQLHVARTICRRAEREITALVEVDPDLAEGVIPYVNRLSDLLFVVARYLNQQTGHGDEQHQRRDRRQARRQPQGR